MDRMELFSLEVRPLRRNLIITLRTIPRIFCISHSYQLNTNNLRGESLSVSVYVQSVGTFYFKNRLDVWFNNGFRI